MNGIPVMLIKFAAQNIPDMKKIVLVFGLIMGAILTGVGIYMAVTCCKNPEMKTNDVMGYAGMLLIFSLIFIAVKNYRDKYNGGVISFGKAFKVGLYVSLIASTMYVGVWLIVYYLFLPEFIDQYTKHVLYTARVDSATPAELADKAKYMAQFKEWYKNPLFVIVQSYLEVLPIGVIVALVAAFVWKRKVNPSNVQL